MYGSRPQGYSEALEGTALVWCKVCATGSSFPAKVRLHKSHLQGYSEALEGTALVWCKVCAAGISFPAKVHRHCKYSRKHCWKKTIK
mmetsp:Transcript_40701/g.80407  ORF Transcript_40701/g.80407 Transcript_40701/m.80407 type:complete len:87 (-) Transcript_40701:664-924(-)